VPAENSVMFYLALRKAGVPAELHIYERGPPWRRAGVGGPRAGKLAGAPRGLVETSRAHKVEIGAPEPGRWPAYLRLHACPGSQMVSRDVALLVLVIVEIINCDDLAVRRLHSARRAEVPPAAVASQIDLLARVWPLSLLRRARMPYGSERNRT